MLAIQFPSVFFIVLILNLANVSPKKLNLKILVFSVTRYPEIYDLWIFRSEPYLEKP